MSGWVWPNGGPVPPQVPNSMSSTEEYGWRTWTQPARMHWGIDLYINDYQIHCASDGVVTERGYNGGAGNEIVVQHDDGSQTRYKHNAYFAAGTGVGTRVSTGQVLAHMGSTGDSTGDHCHFEVRENPAENAVEPRAFMAARTTYGLPGSPTSGNTTTQNDEDEMRFYKPNSGSVANYGFAIGNDRLICSPDPAYDAAWLAECQQGAPVACTGDEFNRILSMRGIPWAVPGQAALVVANRNKMWRAATGFTQPV